jgi:uncharacterized membrane protein (UPF0127 family)
MADIKAEIANDHLTRSIGLMGRKHLPDDQGMLFVFDRPEKLSFWMSNTYLPLSIAFLNDNGRILQIEDMVPMSTKSVRARTDCKYALEVNEGWFSRNGISLGAQVGIPSQMGQDPAAEQQQMQQQQVSPDVQLILANKDIFKLASVPLLIDYTEKYSNTRWPGKRIEPPYDLGPTEDEREASGLMTCFDSSAGRVGSFVVRNISAVYDLKGTQIVSKDQIDILNSGEPLTQEDANLAEGIEQSVPPEGDPNLETGVESIFSER